MIYQCRHREVRDRFSRLNVDSQLAKSLPNGMRSLQQCPWRVAGADDLMKLKGFGAKTAGVSSWLGCSDYV